MMFAYVNLYYTWRLIFIYTADILLFYPFLLFRHDCFSRISFPQIKMEKYKFIHCVPMIFYCFNYVCNVKSFLQVFFGIEIENFLYFWQKKHSLSDFDKRTCQDRLHQDIASAFNYFLSFLLKRFLCFMCAETNRVWKIVSLEVFQE